MFLAFGTRGAGEARGAGEETERKPLFLIAVLLSRIVEILFIIRSAETDSDRPQQWSVEYTICEPLDCR